VAAAHLERARTAAVVSAQHTQIANAVQGAAQEAAALTAPAPLPPRAQDLVENHLNAAQDTSDAGLDHAVAATEANQAAAQNTAEASKKARTAAERTGAAQSAAEVLAREKKIAEVLASFGVGQCGLRVYSRVSVRVKDQLLTKLHREGMTVTGDNPWNIETHQYEVRLRAIWDPKGQELKLIVTAGKGGYFGLVTCDEIWKKIDPIMRAVIG
jgi:hypothetical protein